MALSDEQYIQVATFERDRTAVSTPTGPLHRKQHPYADCAVIMTITH